MQMCVWRRVGTELFEFGSGGAQGAFDLWRKAILRNQIVSIHDKADVIELGISSAQTIIRYIRRKGAWKCALAQFFKHKRPFLFRIYPLLYESYAQTAEGTREIVAVV
jgi:hypothetical protein